jgi:hypothetical protein
MLVVYELDAYRIGTAPCHKGHSDSPAKTAGNQDIGDHETEMSESPAFRLKVLTEWRKLGPLDQ